MRIQMNVGEIGGAAAFVAPIAAPAAGAGVPPPPPEKGCIAGKACFIIDRFYTMEGFTNLAKASIAMMRLSAFVPAIGSLFEGVLDTMEPQKDLLYATNVFNSWGNLVSTDKNGNRGWTEITKVLTAVGDVFESGAFMKKYMNWKFPLCSKAAVNLGSMKVFTFKGQDWLFDDLPVFHHLCGKPKDFFVFWASLIEVCKYGKLVLDKDEKLWHWERMLKAANCLGKMILIWTTRHHAGKLAFAIVDVITQNASLIKQCVVEGNKYDRHHLGLVPSPA